MWHAGSALSRNRQRRHPSTRSSTPLQALRTGVAVRSVEELCQTPEGTLGLVRGLSGVIKSNPALLLQLRSLLK